jgi:GMP synthase (glutamine-hydrolysing)
MILIVNNTRGAKGSYYPKVIDYFRSRRIPHAVVDSLAALGRVDQKAVRGIVLTGSPLMVNADDMGAHPEQFLLNIRVLEDYGVPVMGICFGCQLLNQLYGGKVKRMGSLFHRDALLSGVMPVRFSLHYVIDKVAPSFETIASASIRGHQVPAFIKHRTLPIYGCLFHPEVYEETRAAFLDRFMRVCDM